MQGTVRAILNWERQVLFSACDDGSLAVAELTVLDTFGVTDGCK